jgi:two-component system response regulator PilR (NtrC family)
VLVVEDETSIRELQLAILSSLGTTAVGACTGQEAIRCLQGKTYDLIVSDLKMPGEISGQDLYRWAERNCPANASRFLFVTGDTANEATLRFLEASGRPNLLKPFSVEDYVSILRRTLDAVEQTT